jgi:hypothetical protein
VAEVYCTQNKHQSDGHDTDKDQGSFLAYQKQFCATYFKTHGAGKFFPVIVVLCKKLKIAAAYRH